MTEPPKRKLYPLSELELQELRTQLQTLTESGRIVPSSSPYGAPILFAARKSGQGLWTCNDYRSLNANAIADQFSLHRIGGLLSCLRGVRVFSKLDLRDGYHQIPIKEEDCYKTAFNCHYGAFEFNVMQFGLKNDPADFQRTMIALMANLVAVCVLVYLDDIIIFGKNAADHQKHVVLVF